MSVISLECSHFTCITQGMLGYESEYPCDESDTSSFGRGDGGHAPPKLGGNSSLFGKTGKEEKTSPCHFESF